MYYSCCTTTLVVINSVPPNCDLDFFFLSFCSCNLQCHLYCFSSTTLCTADGWRVCCLWVLLSVLGYKKQSLLRLPVYFSASRQHTHTHTLIYTYYIYSRYIIHTYLGSSWRSVYKIYLLIKWSSSSEILWCMWFVLYFSSNLCFEFLFTYCVTGVRIANG